MDIPKKPLINLLNTDVLTKRKLEDKFNVSHAWMNGYKENIYSGRSLYLPYISLIPKNLHESEIVVIDTSLRGIINGENYQTSINVMYTHTPSFVSIMPLDMAAAIKNIFSTEKRQLVFVFCGSYANERFTLTTESGGGETVHTNTYCFPDPVSVKEVSGKRMQITEGDDALEIKNCIKKYLEGSEYKYAFRIRSGGKSTDAPLVVNETKDVVSFIRVMGNKLVFFLPPIDDQAAFIEDLFCNVLPDIKGFDSFFPENGKFKWITDFSYVSIEEKNKSIEIDEKIKEYEDTIRRLKKEYEFIHDKQENVYLRNMLKETGDDLVLAVKWFLEEIGFNNVIDPDKDVDVNAGEVFEEDLNFEHDGIKYLLEVKGLGGTSTDAQCAQVSKIALRRKKANKDSIYKSIYIVNHRRYRAPKEREAIPFNDNQIEDAEMSNRGMTFTYELFQVYHMIEAGILRKEAVREAFKQEGLIDFRKSLYPLTFNKCYKVPVVYSLIMEEKDGLVMNSADKIAIQDGEDHWHLLNIVSLEIDGERLQEVKSGKVGIKVDRLVPGARDYYLVKVSEGLQDA